jgi:hypothetical protein
MKPYGKPSLITYSCGCCTEKTEHRSKSKSELRRLIIEEGGELVLDGNTVPKSEINDYCPVCGDYKNEKCISEC